MTHTADPAGTATLPKLSYLICDTPRSGSTLRGAALTDTGGVVRYSAPAIRHLRDRLDEHNGAWQAYFSACGIAPFKVVYEAFVRAYEGTVRRLLNELGVVVSATFRVHTPSVPLHPDGGGGVGRV